MVDSNATPLATFTSIQTWPKISICLYENEVEVHSPGILGMGSATERLRYEQIAKVSVNRKITYSLLSIESTGGHTIGKDVRLDHEDAREAHERIRQRLELMNSSPSATSPNMIDIPAQIKALAELKEANIITQAEFETKKKELLDRL